MTWINGEGRWNYNFESYPMAGTEEVVTKTKEIAEQMPSIIRVEQTSPNGLRYWRAPDAIMQDVSQELADKVQAWLDDNKLTTKAVR